MLTITETACALLTQLLVQEEQPDDVAIRIEHGPTGDLALRFDTVQPDDTTFAHEQKTVLVCDTQIAQTLVSSTLDVQDTEEGAKLIIRR